MTGSDLPVARTVQALRAQVKAWRESGLRVALAPTMGALHEGHLSLIRLAAGHADRVVASLFVNPTQFAPHEDFAAYPRDEARDASLLASAGCHLLFAPSPQEMYPAGFATTVSVSKVSEPLEGQARPHHFAGVATVVAKLLIQCGPDVAVFGEKDYQQLQVIRRLVRDLDLPVDILGAPTQRDEAGLALSSRNAYLTSEQIAVARKLNQIMADAVARLRGGAKIASTEAEAVAALTEAGFAGVDYFEVRGAEDLARLPDGAVAQPARLLAAVRLGSTRLIDNMAV